VHSLLFKNSEDRVQYFLYGTLDFVLFLVWIFARAHHAEFFVAHTIKPQERLDRWMGPNITAHPILFTL